MTQAFSCDAATAQSALLTPPAKRSIDTDHHPLMITTMPILARVAAP